MPCMSFVYPASFDGDMLIGMHVGLFHACLVWNGMFSRGGMARYSWLDIRNGANSTRAGSWVSGEPSKWAFHGVFQQNKC